MSILKKIVHIPYSASQYVRKAYTKNQIVLHHTVSGGSAEAVARYWKTLSNKVGTFMIIDKEGIPHQLFGSQYYAGHVGGTKEECDIFRLPHRNCSKHSIGIELVNWGWLIKKEDGIYNSYGKKVDTPVTYYKDGYRGYNYYDSYTDEQIATLKELLTYLGEKYNIPLTYDHKIFDLHKEALAGKPGVFMHASFRLPKDKTDLHPQPELIKMLRSLDIVEII